MSDEKKPQHPEVTFLPPLEMILSFFKKKKNQKNDVKDKPTEQQELEEQAVEKIIEKLSKDT